MIESLNSGLSGLQAFQNDLNIIGNNVANSNTVGYKSSRADFSDTLSQTIIGAGYGSASAGLVGQQVGSGVATAEVQTIFSAGTLSQTGVSSDLAVSNGSGFFMVKDPTSGLSYVTQAGDFTVDSQGFLVTSNGCRVQGNPTAAGAPVTPSDIQINATGAPSSATTTVVSGYNIAANGTITVTLADGTSFVRGQVYLQNFNNPQALVNQGGNLYTVPASAGATTAGGPAGGQSGTGNIVQGSLEMSNVDLSAEFAQLITAQQGFEANSKVVTTSNEILQTITGLIR
jgi:flagellar hook protein FlgE